MLGCFANTEYQFPFSCLTIIEKAVLKIDTGIMITEINAFFRSLPFNFISLKLGIAKRDENRDDLTYSTGFHEYFSTRMWNRIFRDTFPNILFFSGKYRKIDEWATILVDVMSFWQIAQYIGDIFQRLNFGRRKWILFGYPSEWTFKYQWLRERENPLCVSAYLIAKFV